MKKLLLLIFLVSFFYKTNAQVTFTDSNLPIVVINTGGQTIYDSIKIVCDMGIIFNGIGSRNYITDPFNNYTGKIGIEIRGSTSQQYPKKCYGLETRDTLGNNRNVPLLGMPSDNDWILYGAYPDKSLMRNEITYTLFSLMEPYSPRYKYCELVIDGQYMGVYTLMEKIKRDHNRVNVTPLLPADTAGVALTGGYIIKIDKPTGSSSTSWTSPYQVKVKYLFHDPQDSALSTSQKTYIQNYVTAFEDAVYGPNFTDSAIGYRHYINVLSFIDFFIMEELGRTVDGYRSSSFMYKDTDSLNGKLTCSPMWDFNLSYGNADYCEAFDTTGWQYNFASVCPAFSSEPPNWWARLLQDTTYCNELKCRWMNLRTNVLSNSLINSLIDTTAARLNEAQQRNFVQWPILGVYVNWNYFIGMNYQEEVDYLKWWFGARMAYMDANLPGHCTMLTTNTNANISDKNTSFEVFPNPNNGTFTIGIFNLTGKADVDITDILGNKIYHTITSNPNTIVDLSKEAKGIYFVKLKSDKGRSTKKIVVE